MCIRDRKQVKDFLNEMFRMTGQAYLDYSPKDIVRGIYEFSNTKISKPAIMDYLKFDLNLRPQPKGRYTCLLYTSDAADE